MTKLTDTQAILLTAAAARADRSLLPPPASLTATAERVRKAVGALIKRELAREVEVAGTVAVWREDGDLRFGVVITAAGLAAVGIEPDDPAGSGLSCDMEVVPQHPGAAMVVEDEAAAVPDGTATEAPLPPAHAAAAASPVRPASKIAQVLVLLRRDEGATLAELVAATGWLPHTTRAALTGLRKQGHALDKRKRGEVTCYHAGAAA